MILEIIADSEYKCFDVVTKNQKFASYPKAFYGRGGRTVCTTINRKNWYKDLEDIASFVNNELKEECSFTIG